MAGDARGLGSEKRANERLLWLGFSLAPFRSSNDRFLQNMEFIRLKNWMPKVVFNFRRGGSISQQRGFFAAKGYFRSPFRSSKIGRTVLRNGTRVPKRCFAAAKHPAKWDFLCYGDFAAISQLRNEVTMLRNGTHVPRGGFAEGGMGLRK